MAVSIKMNKNTPTTKSGIIGYWISTGLLIFELLYGALWDFNLLNKGYVYDTLTHLGYPLYLASILGVSKILAAIAIRIPGLGILTEWAYSGIVILFAGAVVSHMASGDEPGKYVFAFIFLLISLASWKLKNVRATP